MTFLLIAGLWRVHNRITNLMHGYDTGSFWINTLWLAGIVVLPWASSLAGERWQDGKWAGGPSALFYWLVIAFISAMATAMRFYVHSHRDLIETDSTETWDAQIALGARRRGVILSVGLCELGSEKGVAFSVAQFVHAEFEGIQLLVARPVDGAADRQADLVVFGCLITERGAWEGAPIGGVHIGALVGGVRL